MFGKPASGKGAVRRHGDVVLGTESCHLPLFLTEDQIIMPLDGDKFRKAFFFRQSIRLCQLIGKTVGNSDIPGFSLFHNTVQAIHNIIKRRFVIPHMINIEIHIIQSKILQAGIDHLLNMLLAGDPGSDLFLSARQKFGCDHHIIPLCKVTDRPSYILLTGAALVTDGSVKKVDAKLQPPFDDLPGMFLIQCPSMLSVPGVAKSHSSHTDT